MSTPIIQLKIILKGTRPEVWRRLQVPANFTMRKVHEALNAAMGWECSHLHSFHIGGKTIGNTEFDDMGEMLNDKKVHLMDVVNKTKKFEYNYDFGDGWQHDVVVEKTLKPGPNEKYPICLDGKNACPPEDCGGIWGFEEFKQAVADPKHPQHSEMLEWYGERYEPTLFDPNIVNKSALRRKRLSAAVSGT
jgi:hypothetical protein